MSYLTLLTLFHEQKTSSTFPPNDADATHNLVPEIYNFVTLSCITDLFSRSQQFLIYLMAKTFTPISAVLSFPS